MLAMQYTVRLAGDFGVDKVRERVENRHCLFDDLSGLLHKSFLYNQEEALYAPFYVWESDEAARNFLTGDLFQGLVEKFGRPRVRCWTILEFAEFGDADAAHCAIKESDSIAAETALQDLMRNEKAHHEAAGKVSGIGCHLVGIDPDRWELMRYSTWTGRDQLPVSGADMIEIYEILHLCRPSAAA